jgi:hypothetical protein
LEVEPAGADRDEHVPDARMLLEPDPGGHAVVRGQIVGDHIDVPDGVGVLDQLKELLVEGAVAGGGGHRELLPVADP